MKKRKIWYIAWLAVLINLVLPSTFAASMVESFDRGLEAEIGYYNYQSVLATRTLANVTGADLVRVNRIFERLVAVAERRQEIQLNLTIVQDPVVNAFAIPAGYIFVNSGLLDFVQTDAELAGVLAHEIAHVEKRHGMKALYRTAGMSAVLGLAINRSGSSHKQQLNRLAMLSLTLIQLGYSREAEYEADRYGVELMTRAGYRKAELVNFWKRMQTNSGGDNGMFQMFSTHPPLNERIKRIEEIGI